jgi:hypothetical protein
VIGVGKNGIWEFEIVPELAALVLIVDADCYNLGFSGGELIVISSQTGQLSSAIRSPVATVEHEHDFSFAGVIFERYVCSFR